MYFLKIKIINIFYKVPIISTLMDKTRVYTILYGM